MSRINLNNYEAFWLDYMEGNLSSEDQAEFILFASQHPELEIDLDEELIHLSEPSSALSSEEKHRLKEIAELEELVVLDLDGELNDLVRFEALKSKHSENYHSLIEDYAKTKLLAPSVVYSEKKDLKQTVVISMYVRIAVAAGLIGFIALFFPWDSSSLETILAQNNEATIDTPDVTHEMASFIEVGVSQHKTFKFKELTLPSSFNHEKNDSFIAKDGPQEAPENIIETPSNDAMFVEELEIAYDTTKTDNNDQVAIIDSIANTDVESDNKTQDLTIKPVNKDLTVPEFLAEKVLKVEKKEEEPLFASILDQKTNWDVDYQETESDDKKITQFKLGKFEFYKSAKR